MGQIKRLCVYCGSSGKVGEAYRTAARELGERLAASGIELVYGGGRIGLMGIIADAVLDGGGRVTGVIPTRLRDAEVAHQGATELIVVDTMHDRKRVMAERSDAFAVLPGGIGTLDETFEIMTWRLLGLHDKPIFLVDVAGYWQPLLALFDHIVASGFASGLTGRLIEPVSSVARLMDMVDRPA
ncbi:MAG: TIGR00730 family Rossman fold protein [Stellaceae bacterium]